MVKSDSGQHRPKGRFGPGRAAQGRLKTVPFVNGTVFIKPSNRGRRGEDGEATLDTRQPDRPHGSACPRSSQPASMPVLHRPHWDATLVVIDPERLDKQVYAPQPGRTEHDVRFRALRLEGPHWHDCHWGWVASHAGELSGQGRIDNR